MNALRQLWLVFLGCSSLCGMQKEWNVYIYMEPNVKLQQAAFKNINQIMSSVSDACNVFVYLHAYDDEVFLYQLTRNSMNLLETMPWTASVTDTIIDSMMAVEKNASAHQHAFIFWGNGYGILNPHYDAVNESWLVNPDGPQSCSCPLKRGVQKRGFLVNSEKQTFITNTEMVRLMQAISKQVLNGKKIEICGMDCCKGAMVEHAYQIRDYVDYFIASQECELADGWPYHLIMKELGNNGLSSKQFAQSIVQAYQEYYAQHSQEEIYTVSAIDVSLTAALAQAIDALVQSIDDPDESMIYAIQYARERCRPFCDASMYADLYSFCANLLEGLQTFPSSSKGINEKANAIMLLIKKMVIANATGEQIKDDAHGISIYFPQYEIDQSYQPTVYAQETQWQTFLEKIVTRVL